MDRWLGKEIGIDEIVALHSLAGNDGDGTREHGAGEGEGMELAELAAGIDLDGQVGEQAGIEDAAGERRAERARVNASEMRAQTCGDHLAGKFGSGDSQVRAPDWKYRLEARAGELFDAVGADVLEEEVAKGDSVKAFGGGASADLRHARLVVGVRAGEGKVDLPEWQADGGGLLVEELFAEAVDGDAAELLIDRGQEGNDLVLIFQPKQMQCPGAVFAAAPTEQDALADGILRVDFRQRWRGTTPPVYTPLSFKVRGLQRRMYPQTTAYIIPGVSSEEVSVGCSGEGFRPILTSSPR